MTDGLGGFVGACQERPLGIGRQLLSDRRRLIEGVVIAAAGELGVVEAAHVVDHRRRRVLVVVVVFVGTTERQRVKLGQLGCVNDQCLVQIGQLGHPLRAIGCEHLVEDRLDVVVADVVDRQRARRMLHDPQRDILGCRSGVGELPGQHAIERDTDGPGVVSG